MPRNATVTIELRMRPHPLPDYRFQCSGCWSVAPKRCRQDNAAADRKKPTASPLVRRAVCVDVPLNPMVAGTAAERL
jgi:hypothetical protein